MGVGRARKRRAPALLTATPCPPPNTSGSSNQSPRVRHACRSRSLATPKPPSNPSNLHPAKPHPATHARRRHRLRTPTPSRAYAASKPSNPHPGTNPLPTHANSAPSTRAVTHTPTRHPRTPTPPPTHTDSATQLLESTLQGMQNPYPAQPCHLRRACNRRVLGATRSAGRLPNRNWGGRGWGGLREGRRQPARRAVLRAAEAHGSRVERSEIAKRRRRRP